MNWLIVILIITAAICFDVLIDLVLIKYILDKSKEIVKQEREKLELEREELEVEMTKNEQEINELED